MVCQHDHRSISLYSCSSAADEHGNRNNVVHVKPESNVDAPSSTIDSTAKAEAALELAQKQEPIDDREDGTVDSSRLDDLPSIPVPFVVVEKVADRDQPEYGHVEPESLQLDTAKRAADAEPDFEQVRADPLGAPDPPMSPEVPLVVVDKTDDRPAYGDDFGKNATSAQKAAHDMRAADAAPDRLIISSSEDTEAGAEEEQAAPLFSHESCPADDPPLASPMDTIDEESAQSSADLTSSSEIINTPSEHDESHDEDELSQCPLLPHEAGFDDRNGESAKTPLFSHETDLPTEEADERDDPLLLDENKDADKDSGVASDEEDELDMAPLLPHESGFSHYGRSENSANSGFLEDDDSMVPQHYAPYADDGERVTDGALEPDHAPTFSHEYDAEDDDVPNDEYDDTPLLPHERASALASKGSELSADDAHDLQYGGPSYENDNSRVLFGGNGRPNVFRTRSNSSSLPHNLPRSDAEDENLNDPSLERFPTSREQILERVASIGLQLPEDETIEDSLHSPQLSVLSQACSSVDLVPVKSYTSLASVPEADDSDEEEDQDVESLPSPITFSSARAMARFARDPHATPLADHPKQLGHGEERVQAPGSRAAESSEADSVGKHDGAKDNSTIFSTLREAIATPSNVLDPITPPLTPEGKVAVSSRDTNAPATDSQLRQRRAQTDDAAATSPPPPAGAQATKEKDLALAQKPHQQNKSFLPTLIRTVFGSVGRFLAACAGDRRRAR